MFDMQDCTSDRLWWKSCNGQGEGADQEVSAARLWQHRHCLLSQDFKTQDRPQPPADNAGCVVWSSSVCVRRITLLTKLVKICLSSVAPYNRLVRGQHVGILVWNVRASPTSLMLCVTAQVRKTRDMTWNPVRTTEDGTIPVRTDQRQQRFRVKTHTWRQEMHIISAGKMLLWASVWV